MDITTLGSLTESLSRPDISIAEHNELVAKLKVEAREVLSALTASRNVEHISVACQLLHTLNIEYSSLLDVQTVLPDLLRIMMEPRMIRGLALQIALEPVVALLHGLITSQFVPSHHSILHIFIFDTMKLLNNSIDALKHQETLIASGTKAGTRTPYHVAAFASFYACKFDVVCDTAKTTLSHLDLSRHSPTLGLSVGLSKLLCALLPHASNICQTTIDYLWTSLPVLMGHHIQNILDEEPQPSVVCLLASVQDTLLFLLRTSLLPSAAILSSFVKQIIQITLLALFCPLKPSALDTWRPVLHGLAAIWKSLASQPPNFTLSCFPRHFVPSIAEKIELCNDWSLTVEFLGAFFSRMKISFVPPGVQRSILQALPLMLPIAELSSTIRLFSSFLFHFKLQLATAQQQHKQYIAALQLNKKEPSTDLTKLERQVSNTSTTSSSSGLSSSWGGLIVSKEALKLMESTLTQESPLKKKIKSQLMEAEAHDASDHQTGDKSKQKSEKEAFFEPFTEECNRLHAILQASRASKADSCNEEEARFLVASITRLNIFIDTLEIKNNGATTTALNLKRRKQSSASNLASISSHSPLAATFGPVLQFRLCQSADVEALANRIFGLIKILATHFLDRFSGGKLAPLGFFQAASSFLDSVVDLMTILPHSDTILPSWLDTLLSRLTETPLAHLMASSSLPSSQGVGLPSSAVPISRPSMIPMPSQGNGGSPQKSSPVLQVNAQLSDAPEVLGFVDRCILVSILMQRPPTSTLLDEPHSLLVAASKDTHRPPIALSALHHFPLALARLPEEHLQNGSLVSSFFRTALSVLKAQTPFSDQPSQSQLSAIHSVSCFLSRMACTTNLCHFTVDDPSNSKLTSERNWIAVIRSNQANASFVDGSNPARFSLLCECKNCSKHLFVNNSNIQQLVRSMTFWPISTQRLRVLSKLSIEWEHFWSLLAQSHEIKVTPSIRTLLFHAQSTLLAHCVVPLSHYNRRNQWSVSPSSSTSSRNSGSIRNRLTSNAMDVDEGRPESQELSADFLAEITKLFTLALTAPTLDLRTSAADAIVMLLEPNTIKGSSLANNAILQEMTAVANNLNRSASQPAMSMSLDDDVDGVETTMLNLVGRIGSVAQGWYVLPTLIQLLNYLTDIRIPVKSCAYYNIRRISAEHGMEPKEMLSSFEPKICAHLTKHLQFKSSLLDEVCTMILAVDPVDYLLKWCPSLLPKICLKRDGALLEMLASKTGRKIPSLLIDSMAAILVATVCTPDTTIDIIEFIVVRVNLTVLELFSKFKDSVLKGIILLLGDDEERKRVPTALNFLTTALSMASAAASQSHTLDQDPHMERPSKFSSIAEFLADRFLPLSNRLVYDHILKPNASQQEKLNAVISYKRLVKLLGPHLDRFYVIIGSVLRLTVSECPELREATFKAWKSFLKQLPDRCLGPILGATTVYLLSYESYESQIVPILEHLFITRESSMKSYFRDVPLLPDRPALAKVHAKWKEATNDLTKSTSSLTPSSTDLRAQLSQLISLAKNDDGSIREMALKQLINFLRLHSSEMARIAIGEHGVDSTIVSLMEMLVNGSREPIAVVRLKFARALGELGAIDPTRLKLPPSVTLPQLDHTEEEFAVELIENYLVKTYRTARNVRNQDRACFTMQEILRYFGCDPSTPTRPFSSARRDTVLWSKLATETRSLVHPFLTSEYILHPTSKWLPSSQIDGSSPISAYQPGMAYPVWLETWLERLILDSKSDLFQACSAFLSIDLETSHFILPHVVLCILQQGSQAAQDAVLHEMLVVLGARQASQASAASLTTSAVHTDSINTMAAQRIFALIDCLSQFVESKYKELRQKQKQHAKETNPDSNPVLDPRVSIVERLLDEIPQLAVAKTALQCNANSRALRHFENSIRTNNTNHPSVQNAGIPGFRPLTSASEIALLQQIYGLIDDPDAMEGLAHMKAGKAVVDLVDEYRASGRWNEGLVALDQLMRQKELSGDALCNLQSGRLECLAELGLFDQLLNLASSCMTDSTQVSNPKHIQKVRSYAAHAAWKLGDWKSVEGLISDHSKSTHGSSHSDPSVDFDLGLARSLLALKNKKRATFEHGLQEIRVALMQPLAAASLESYDRAYPLVVKLQMLNELEVSWKLVHGSESDQGIASTASVSPPLPFGNDPSNPTNVSITHPDVLDKSIAGLMHHSTAGSVHEASTTDLSVVPASLMRSSTPVLLHQAISVSDRTLKERKEILEEWRDRLQMTQFSYKVREAILSLRMAVFGLANMQREATETWLLLAQTARKNGRFTMAQYAMLKVREGAELASAVESAKLLWASNNRSKALVEVQKIVDTARLARASSGVSVIATSGTSESRPSATEARSQADVARSRLMGDTRTSSGSSLTPSNQAQSKSNLTRSNSSVLVAHGTSERELNNKARLLAAKWMLESQYSPQAIQAAFSEATRADRPTPSKVHYFYGLFNDHLCTEYKRKIYAAFPKDPPKASSKKSSSSSSAASRASDLPPMLTPQAIQYWQTLPSAFTALTSSLLSSLRYCTQILPRLVSMWFEVTEALQDLFVRYHQETTHNANPSSMEPWMLKIPKVESRDKTARAIVETYLTSMRMVSMLLKHMPAYAWLVSYSLLISGCVQRNADVEELIGKIILKVLQHHPQQAIWHIFPLANSTSEERKQKYHWIRKQTASHGVKGTDLSLTQFFDDAAAFATQISALCAHKPPKEKGSTSVEVKLSDMCQMEQRIPKELIMPSEQQLSFVQFLDISKDPKNPFANKPVYIRRAHPKVEILRSLAKPRKLILYGSDELEYWFLCKPVDDLRKDARMMEFSAMVNRLLKKDLETRKRELRIRTYAVLPLSDGSGILSWVRATNGLRGIINDTYAMDGLDLTEKIKEIRHWFEKGQAEAGDWEQQFVEKLLPRFPLALSKWFLLNFTEPSKWLRARTNFARTCGVMSVIGTILGLGDRHCENILIDSENGDCLHVDLNCLFFKGKTFLIPEVVPFRLTRNMVDAFGVMGFEGVFRKACEHTMQIMRQNKDALMSVLGTFVHDPLLEWNDGISPPIATRHQKTITSAMDAANTHYSHERYNRMAVDILNGIADRLDGMMRNPDNMDQIIVPLSVQGYVDAVIREATSPANLCKMYVGWSSFL